MRVDEKTKNGLSNLPDRIVIGIGNAASWLIALLIVIILFQVVLRYMFHKSFVALEEVQWHLYAVVVLLSISYSYVKDSHIRLDIMHSQFSVLFCVKFHRLGKIVLEEKNL